jgi:hypothetical protein
MLETTRKFLATVPNLGALMDNVVVEAGVNVNNFEDLKGAREDARDTVLQRLREEKGLHTVVMYPELLDACSTCAATLRGGYIELNNVSTGKACLIPMFVWHQFVEHGVLDYVETLVNLGNSKVSERPIPLDFTAMLIVMKEANMPSDVVQEIQTNGPQIKQILDAAVAKA